MHNRQHLIIASTLALLLPNTLRAEVSPSYIDLQVGSNFEDQEQIFANFEFTIGELGSLSLGAGTSDYDVDTRLTLTTDYFSIGYNSPGDGDTTLSLNYDYWELRTMQANSYTASLQHYVGNWDFGIHPELHYIDVDRPNSPNLHVRNIGAGASLGYFFTNTYLYGSYYSYNFSSNLPPAVDLANLPQSLYGSLSQTEQQRLARRSVVENIIQQQISSSLDKRRSNVGIDYYFEKARIGTSYQQGTSVIDNTEYKVTSLDGSIDLNEHWQLGAGVSHTHGAEHDYYSGSLGYYW